MASYAEETGLLWTQPSWRRGAEAWIRDRLGERGFAVDAIEQPHVRPWATALRAATDRGAFWFKSNIPPLAYEIPLIELVASRRPEAVPRLVASDLARGWMLMEDAGPALDRLHPDGAPTATWQEFLGAYAELQIEVAPMAEELLSAGVPDRRLPNLVGPLRRVLGNERLVSPATDAALTGDELERLRVLLPRLDEAVEALAAFDLPSSIHHDDLHLWNVCPRADGGYRFIDWGDACVSQPLLSLSVPLAHIGPERAEVARDAYLEPWAAYHPRDELIASCKTAVLLAQVTGVLKWELINSALTDEERAGYEDVIPARLRYLLELACA